MRVCARVLAAALMIGAITGALSFPAWVNPGRDPQRVLTAPASERQRTLRLPALAAPAQHTISVHRRTAPTAAAAALIDVRVQSRRPGPAIVKRVSVAQAGGSVAATPAPAAPAGPPPAPAPPAATPPPAPTVTTTAAPEPTQARELAATEQPTTQPVPPVPPAVSRPPAQQEHGNDDGGDSHGKEHEKQRGNNDAGPGNAHGNGDASGHDKEDAMRG